jgi:hypothetical protein
MEIHGKLKCKGKAIPLQALTGPEFSRKLRLFKTTSDKAVNPMHQPPIPTKYYSCYSFLSEAELTPGP